MREFNNRPKKPEGLLFGIRPVIEAIKAGKEIEKVFLLKELRSTQFAGLYELLQERNIPFVRVPEEKLLSFTNGNHQGVVAIASPIEYQDIEQIIPFLYEEGKTPFILVLDRITDVRNFGAIARTAECCGVDAIVIPHKGGAGVTPDAMKTSAGALSKIAVCREMNLNRTVDFLRKSGLKIAACTEKADQNLYQADLTGPLAIIMGSEEDGIDNQILKLADVKARIPLAGEIESLNVSVATGVICYEALRQRQL